MEKREDFQTLNQSCKIMDFGVFHLSILQHYYKKSFYFFLLSVLHNSLFIRIMTILVAHKQITQNVYYKQEILKNRCKMGFFYTQTRYVSNIFFRQGMCPNSCPQSFVSPWSKRAYHKRRLFDKSGYGTGYVVYQILNLSNNQ